MWMTFGCAVKWSSDRIPLESAVSLSMMMMVCDGESRRERRWLKVKVWRRTLTVYITIYNRYAACQNISKTGIYIYGKSIIIYTYLDVRFTTPTHTHIQTWNSISWSWRARPRFFRRGKQNLEEEFAYLNVAKNNNSLGNFMSRELNTQVKKLTVLCDLQACMRACWPFML